MGLLKDRKTPYFLNICSITTITKKLAKKVLFLPLARLLPQETI